MVRSEFSLFIYTSLYLFIGSPNSQAQQLYCPGQSVELSCMASLGVIWQGSAFTGQCASENDIITVIAAQSAVGSTTTCGNFTATVISLTPGSLGAVVVDVSLMFRADVSLNGTTVQCEDANPNDPLEVDQLLDIPATTTQSPTLILNQNSQSIAGVTFVINDARCVTNYHVNVAQEGGSTTSVSESSSPVIVGDLDLCQYSYSFVGYTTSMTGVVGEISASVNLTVNLTAVNGVTVTIKINQIDLLIEWTQTPNPLYPTCITGYVVTDHGNPFLTTTVDSNTTSLTAQQLNAAGFPYCISIQPAVTPMTPIGPLITAVGSSITLFNPDFPTPMFSHSFTLTSGTISLQITVQESEVPSRTYQYTNDNGAVSSMMSFTGDSFVISLSEAEDGQVIQVTVMFVNGACSSSNSANYIVPSLEISNVTQGETAATSHSVTVTLPLTMYPSVELLIISTVSPPDSIPIIANFTGPSIKHTVTFDNLKPATDYIFSVRIVLRTDNTMMNVVAPVTGTFTTAPIPSVMIISSAGQQTSAPAYTVTLTLPVISYPRSELIIISTLTPADSAPITDDYPLSSQYFVTFHSLNVGVEYSYVIRIVLRRSNSINVSIPLTGSFTIMTSFSTEAFSTGAAVALTFLFTLVLGVSIGALIVVAVNKFRRSEKATLQTETEMRSPPVIYEEPEAIKPDPLTQGNAAYGEIVY